MSNSRAPARNGEAGDIPLGQSASTTAGLQQDNGRLLEINTDIEHQRGVLQAQNASLRGQLEFLQQHVTNLQAEVDGLRQVVTWHEGREQDVVYQAEANRVFGEQLTEQRSQLGHFEDSLDRREYLLVMREERVAAQEDVADAEEDQEDDAIAEHGVEQDEHAAMDRDRSVNWREAAVLGGQNVGTKRERDVDGESPRDAKRVKTEHDGSSAELEEQNKDCPVEAEGYDDHEPQLAIKHDDEADGSCDDRDTCDVNGIQVGNMDDADDELSDEEDGEEADDEVEQEDLE